MKTAPKLSYVAVKTVAMVVAMIGFIASGAVANAAKRVALVIGNSAYENAAPLKNPRNDAEDLTNKLNELGFEVVSGFDLDSRGMRDTVRKFGEKLRGADVAMFFYAGHALQVNGRNYLAPVNTDIRHEGDLDFETIPMDFVQRQMERETKTVLLFLDACRDNPLARSLRATSRSTGATRGLARETNSSEGTFIAFATQPDNVALDGDGRNSPFTTALLANLDRPGVEISTLMTDVRRQVFEATNEQQIPWINSSLLGRFYFKDDGNSDDAEQVASLSNDESKVTNDASSQTTTDKADTVVEEPTTSSSSGEEKDRLLEMKLERLAWESVSESNDPDELRFFIKKYGDGFFGDLAKLRLNRIEKAGKSEEKKVASLEKDDPARKIEVEEVRDERPALDPREAALQVQQQLARLGCSPGRPDGIWGKNSNRALGQFARHAKVRVASTEPSIDLIDQLKTYDRRICPAPVIKKQQVAKCKSGQKINSRGQCYWPKTKQVKTCQPGQKLSRKGNCYWPKQQQVVTCQSGQRMNSRGQCYWPQQQQVIVQPQPQPQQVIIHQPQPVPQPQPQRPSGLLGGAIGGAIGGIVACKSLGTC